MMSRSKIDHSFILFLLLMILSACKVVAPIPTTTVSTYKIVPGDIAIVNTTADSILLLDSNGTFKEVLYTLPNSVDSIYGLAFKYDTNEILFTVNGTPRVGAISTKDGTFRNLILDVVNLTGTLRGLTQQSNGDILIIETSTVERYSTLGVRKTLVSGVTWPNTLGATAAPEQLHTAQNGDIIICGSANVNRFTTNAVRVGAAVVSGIAGTTAANGCLELSNGNIAVAFSGTTDTISTVGASMLQVTIASVYSDLGVLASPKSISQTLNGNILVADSGFNYIVEISPTGSFVRNLASGLVGTPNAVLSIPSF